MFVGGSVTGLLLTGGAASDPRTTLDVDTIAETSYYYGYTQFADRLRSLGFDEDTREGAPVCRWIRARTVLDVMPLDAGILGFSNRWYRAALESAVERTPVDDLVIRVVTALGFVAIKLEAFHGRGEGDFSSSHDMKDVVAVVDAGRPCGPSYVPNRRDSEHFCGTRSAPYSPTPRSSMHFANT